MAKQGKGVSGGSNGAGVSTLADAPETLRALVQEVLGEEKMRHVVMQELALAGSQARRIINHAIHTQFAAMTEAQIEQMTEEALTGEGREGMRQLVEAECQANMEQLTQGVLARAVKAQVRKVLPGMIKPLLAEALEREKAAVATMIRHAIDEAVTGEALEGVITQQVTDLIEGIPGRRREKR